MHTNDINPLQDCPLCPRLKTFRDLCRYQEPSWFNAPVPPFYPKNGLKETRLLIVGLAPGLKGANRTGRPFTGDYAGILLYDTLKKYGFALGDFKAEPDDSLELINTTIVNAVRCVPPQNKPLASEIANCRQFLLPFLSSTQFPQLQAILTLGTVAHTATLNCLGKQASHYKFGHHKCHDISNLRIFSSYHCSRYNTNTNRLTVDMFEAVFHDIQKFLNQNAEAS